MNLKCFMPHRLKMHICYDSIAISFSKWGDYQNRKLTTGCQIQGKGLGCGPLTTRHTWEHGTVQCLDYSGGYMTVCLLKLRSVQWTVWMSMYISCIFLKGQEYLGVILKRAKFNTEFKYLPFLGKIHFNILKTNLLYPNTLLLTDNRN